MKDFLRPIFASLTVLVLPLSILSCSEDNNPIDPHHGHEHTPHRDNAALETVVELGRIEEQGVRVELYGPQQLQMGYVELRVKLIEIATDQHLHDARVEIHPLMQMEVDGSTMMHGAPSEYPAVHDHEDGSYLKPVVFPMAGTWQLEVKYQHDEREGNLSFAAEVHQGDRLKSLTGTDDQSYFVALITPHYPSVGKENLELAVWTRESMRDFPLANDLSIEIDPYMPAMNHGAPGNEQPVLTDNGHYRGKVNFMMSGEWRINLKLVKSESILIETFFDLMVE